MPIHDFLHPSVMWRARTRQGLESFTTGSYIVCEPKRISSNVCTRGDKMISKTPISCIGQFISSGQANTALDRAAIQQTQFT